MSEKPVEPANALTVAELVRAAIGVLPPQERKVARSVLANYPRAALVSSGELANAAGVSPPTVVRFARSLGFSGFPDLQSRLVDELSERHASPISRYAERSPVDGHWLDPGLRHLMDGITSSLPLIPRAELDRTVTLLADPDRPVTAFGGRYSGLIARYLILHLQQIRPNVKSQDELGLSSVADVVDVNRRSVFVVYDLRRYQTSTVERARRVADAGGKVVCITDPWLSPVAQVADVVLPTSVASHGAFDSAAAAFVLTELLVEAVLQRVGDPALDRMKRWDTLSSSTILNDAPLPP